MSVIPSLCPFGGMKGLVTDRKARKRSQVAEVSDQKLLSELNQGTSRMVDTYIYPYPALIRETKPFASVTDNKVKVAIIGSGFAGFCAAYELKQAGIKTIDMYESREKMGGRANTEVIEAGGKSYACEMGAMRVPDNSKLFWHYLSKLQPGQDPSLSPFPNPGIVPTQMLYQCEKFNWHDSDQMPQEWQDISTDFNQFTADGLTYRSEEDSVEITLAQVSELLVKDNLNTADIAIVHTYWDYFLETYEDVSFIEALTTYMDGKDGRPEWGPEQINMFSTLGLGTGGFGPLFPVCFLEIFRLLLWSYTDEYTPNKTMTEIIGLFNDEVQPNYINQTVHYVGIDRTDSNKANVYVRNGDNIEHQQYDFVIVATTLRSMQISMNLDGANAPGFAAQSLPVFNGEANEML
ncbi:MAG: FAD-dependent oxidoreductase, partial [Algicola sp.]|nr:FAD-dependent oxidoreductase [Algicola sp.]